MLNSEIKIQNGRPTLLIDGKPKSAMAYTTYFSERDAYRDFIEAGYRIFFINVSFTRSPINSNTGFTPFRVGVFEDPDMPDYSEFEREVYKLLRLCPDAVIFPRVYVSMPKWWIDSHPEEVVATERGGMREALFSDAFRRDAAELLRSLVRHIKKSDYASRIGGWQLCGGLTQEWFHHDYNGSLSPAAREPYRRWVKRTYGEDGAVLPTAKELAYSGKSYNECENARRYSLFSNLGVAETLDRFAGVVKQEIGCKQIVGAFYGYAYESNHVVVFGSHALRSLLDSPNIDFFSSPNAYLKNRAFGIDWVDMIPVDSIKHHGKLCFIECDIRTYLTTGMQEARPGEYPDGIYSTAGKSSVWLGPPTAELSREALRKCFAHQAAKASAVWWFDMWGGWYADPLLMEELARMKSLYEKDLTSPASPLSPDVVFFADESAYSNLFNRSPHLSAIPETRIAMGMTGVPYDSFMVEDADAVLKAYKAAVFLMPIPSEAGKRAMALCEKLGIPYLSATAEHYALTADELCAFYKNNGIHFYTEENDVVYVGNGYVALHSACGGEKTLRLPRAYGITAVYGASVSAQRTSLLTFTIKENATALFAITE